MLDNMAVEHRVSGPFGYEGELDPGARLHPYGIAPPTLLPTAPLSAQARWRASSWVMATSSPSSRPCVNPPLAPPPSATRQRTAPARSGSGSGLAGNVTGARGALARSRSLVGTIEQQVDCVPGSSRAGGPHGSTVSAADSADASVVTRAAGRRTVTRVPAPGLLSISSRPPCSSVSELTNGRPSPVPW